MVEGSVYFMQMEGTNFVKVGVSGNPKKRLSSIQTSNPVNINLINHFKVKKPYSLEEKFHNKLNSFNYNKEWFWLDFPIIEKIKDLDDKNYNIFLDDEISEVIFSDLEIKMLESQKREFETKINNLKNKYIQSSKKNLKELKRHRRQLSEYENKLNERQEKINQVMDLVNNNKVLKFLYKLL